MRGEYTWSLSSSQTLAELPPRARRILIENAPVEVRRTTSACAENTRQAGRPMDRCWNYLRVRGEYCRQGVLRATQPELPPRARRILRQRQLFERERGTTSACAENTRGRVASGGASGNYLRVRGEYKGNELTQVMGSELPPRARRIRLHAL